MEWSRSEYFAVVCLLLLLLVLLDELMVAVLEER